MGRKMVRQRAEKMSQDTGFMPISVRMVRGSEDAACLDRMAKVYGTRSDALRAAIHALEGRRTHMAASVALGRAEAAEQRAEALAAEVAQARAEGEAAGFRRGVAACVADVEGCLDFAAKAAKGPHNSERLRIHRNVRAVVLGQVAYGLRHIGDMGPRPTGQQD